MSVVLKSFSGFLGPVPVSFKMVHCWGSTWLSKPTSVHLAKLDLRQKNKTGCSQNIICVVLQLMCNIILILKLVIEEYSINKASFVYVSKAFEASSLVGYFIFLFKRSHLWLPATVVALKRKCVYLTPFLSFGVNSLEGVKSVHNSAVQIVVKRHTQTHWILVHLFAACF